jgi:tetratricopeptide (TPR) repeat protein
MMMKKFFLLPLALAFIASASTFTAAQDWDSAISLYNQKQYRPAAQAFHALLKTNPDYWQAWYYIGASHYNLQGYEDAIDAFNNYLKSAEKSGKDEKGQAAAYYYVGFSEYQLKRYDKAIPSLTKYVSLTEKLQQKVEPNARAALGRSYIFSEKYNEAIPVLTASINELKTNASNYYYLAYAHQKLARLDQAITALNQGLAVEPKDVDLLTMLTEIYLSQSQKNPPMLKQAISTGERLVAVKNDENAWRLLGQSYLVDKQYAKAAPLLDKYARAHMDSSSAWINLGIAYSRSSQWKTAAEALEQASKLAPTNLPVMLELGYVYESDKQLDKALSIYEKAYQASGQKDETAKQGIERVKYLKQQPATPTAPQSTTAKKPVATTAKPR